MNASLRPLADMYLADSGSQELARTKHSDGIEDRASNHLQPRDGMTNMAKMTSRHAPSAQKQSRSTTHLPRCLVGRNSAYNVTDCGTQPMLNPTMNLKHKIQP